MTPDALATLHASAFDDGRNWSAAEFENLLNHSGTRVFGDERAVVLVRITLDECEVLTLATAPFHRRKGLAEAVLRLAETEAGKAGATTMFLEVAEDNSPAGALYAKAGYQQVGRRPGYYRRNNQNAVAALVLRKDLPSA